MRRHSGRHCQHRKPRRGHDDACGHCGHPSCKGESTDPLRIRGVPQQRHLVYNCREAEDETERAGEPALDVANGDCGGKDSFLVRGRGCGPDVHHALESDPVYRLECRGHSQASDRTAYCEPCPPCAARCLQLVCQAQEPSHLTQGSGLCLAIGAACRWSSSRSADAGSHNNRP